MQVSRFEDHDKAMPRSAVRADRGDDSDEGTTLSIHPTTDRAGDEHGASLPGIAELFSGAIGVRERGWPVLPLGGANGKELLETGISGYSPNDAGLEDIKYWPNRFGLRWRNVGVRCPIGVLGMDIDHYEKAGKAKRGLTTIAEYESRFGEPLPPTFITTARPGGSGIRWFKVPDDWSGPGALKSLTNLPSDTEAGVELIQRTHRYAVAPGSIHIETGQRYRLYGPDDHEIVGGLLPPPDSLPELPASWRDGLSALCPTGAVVRRDVNGDTIELWLDAYTGNQYPHGLAQVVKHFEDLIGTGRGWDAAMVSALPWALKEARVGGYPAREAVETLRDNPATVAAIAEKPSRADRFDSILVSAVEYAEADDHATRWLRMCREYGTDTRDYAGAADNVKLNTGDETTGEDDSPPSWSPVDMAVALANGEEISTTILARTDGAKLFYRHKVHSVHGESESGKTWLALCAVAECLTGGEPVLYVDFEDDAKGVGARLLLMGVPRAVVTDPALFSYVRPEVGLSADKERKAFEQLLSGVYSVAVVDGVTESMGLLGLVGKDNDQVASWQRTLPNAIARHTGAAVVCIDHVTKDADTRGRFAIGGQQKMAGLSGAAFIIEPETPFARGLAGVAIVRVGKDRPGFLRGLGGDWRKSDRTQLVASFTLDSTDPARVQWKLEPPDSDGANVGQSGHGIDEPRRKFCMEQVSRYWETQNPDGDENPKAKGLVECSTTKTENAMVAEHKGSGIARDLWRVAIGALVVEGYAKQIDGLRKSKLHRVVQPYRASGDLTPNSPSIKLQTVSEEKFRGARESEFDEGITDEAV